MLSLTLLNYARYLRKIGAAVSLDFSALQATCRWIANAVESSSSFFSAVVYQVQLLGDSISLSTGLGLIEIWSTLYVDQPLVDTLTKLNVINTRSALLKGKGAHSTCTKWFVLYECLQTW